MGLIDHFEKVTDRDAALMTRRIAREEAIFVGNSAGSAMAGLLQMKQMFKKDDVVVIIFHDHGTRYLGKMFNDEWMRDRGFIADEMKVSDIIARKKNRDFITIPHTETVKKALDIMKQNDISQIPVMNKTKIVGSITENSVLNFLIENPLRNSDKHVTEIMGIPFPMVDENVPLSQINRYISRTTPAVIAKDKGGSMHILTQYDIIQAI
jgi:cystathionine beta-synthase